MRSVVLLLAAAAALPAAGCVSWSRPAVHLPKPVEIPAEGTFRQEASGMEFPEEVGPFVRLKLVRYDEGGLDVSAGYGAAGPVGSIQATVFVYPLASFTRFLASDEQVGQIRSELQARELAGCKQAILKSMPDAVLQVQEDVTVENGGVPRSGKRVAYGIPNAFGVPGLKGSTLLYLFFEPGGEWIVSYRFTYPGGGSPAAVQALLDRLLEGLPWPFPGVEPR
jgi:hypothetical protein